MKFYFTRQVVCACINSFKNRTHPLTRPQLHARINSLHALDPRRHRLPDRRLALRLLSSPFILPRLAIPPDDVLHHDDLGVFGPGVRGGPGLGGGGGHAAVGRGGVVVDVRRPRVVHHHGVFGRVLAGGARLPRDRAAAVEALAAVHHVLRDLLRQRRLEAVEVGQVGRVVGLRALCAGRIVPLHESVQKQKKSIYVKIINSAFSYSRHATIRTEWFKVDVTTFLLLAQFQKVIFFFQCSHQHNVLPAVPKLVQVELTDL